MNHVLLRVFYWNKHWLACCNTLSPLTLKCARQVNQKDGGAELGLGQSGDLFAVSLAFLTFYTYSSCTTLLGMAWAGAEVVHGSASLEQNDHCADTCVENEAITDNSSLKVEDKNHNVHIACLILTPLWGL